MCLRDLKREVRTMIDEDMDLTQVFARVDQWCAAQQALRKQTWPTIPKPSTKQRVPCRGLTKRLRQPCQAMSEPGTKRCRWHTPKGRRVVCGARRRRDAQPCQARSVKGKARCRWHGGASTGPRTQEGQLRALANLRQFAQASKGEPSISL